MAGQSPVACDGLQGRHWRGGRGLDNRGRGRRAVYCTGRRAGDPIWSAPSGVWPGVRRAGLGKGWARRGTPGQRRRRRRLDL